MKEIIVVFKTHLDIGFTDLAVNVIKKYNEEFIPQALQTAETFAQLRRPEGFVWTTGSWLIHQYLEQATPDEHERMETAIRNGWIRWHALPFTMHSELADEGLYRYGLSLSQNLDKTYGVTTIAAKNTDVPGHTCAIIPLLREVGVQFLHIGVNPASKAPDVPNIFRWEKVPGESIVVMYSKGYYGEFTKIPHTDTAVYFAHTNDNCGVQPAEEIIRLYDRLHEEYPGAVIRAGDLNEVARAVLPAADLLSVFRQEIGDTWIHGAATDPQKIGPYRALLRLAAGWKPAEQKQLYKSLLLIPEHTWGLDEKTYLGDNEHYERTEFEKVADTPRYHLMESAWEEQRSYIYQAIDILPGDKRIQADRVLEQCRSVYPDLSDFQKKTDAVFLANGWEMAFDQSGALVELRKDGVTYADSSHRVGAFRYEVFSENEIRQYMDRYVTIRAKWALEDFGKTGVSAANDRYRCYPGICKEIYQRDNRFCLVLSVDPEASGRFGCPLSMTMQITALPEELKVDFAWYGKPASRIPEACTMLFHPMRPLQAIRKIGSFIDPADVVSNGNREMHAVTDRIRFEGIDLITWDAPVVGIGTSGIYAFNNRIPDRDAGIYVNLFNNQWGTNFPAWNRGDARFRFSLVPTNIR